MKIMNPVLFALAVVVPGAVATTTLQAGDCAVFELSTRTDAQSFHIVTTRAMEEGTVLYGTDACIYKYSWGFPEFSQQYNSPNSDYGHQGYGRYTVPDGGIAAGTTLSMSDFNDEAFDAKQIHFTTGKGYEGGDCLYIFTAGTGEKTGKMEEQTANGETWIRPTVLHDARQYNFLCGAQNGKMYSGYPVAPGLKKKETFAELSFPYYTSKLRTGWRNCWRYMGTKEGTRETLLQIINARSSDPSTFNGHSMGEWQYSHSYCNQPGWFDAFMDEPWSITDAAPVVQVPANPAIDCNVSECKNWSCEQWCACFNSRKEDKGVYIDNGCIEDDDVDSCKCKRGRPVE